MNRMLSVKSKLGDDEKKVERHRKRDAKSTKRNNKNFTDSNAGKTNKRARKIKF